MPRRSVILDHPERERIDELLEAGGSVRGVARDTGAPVESLKRYARRRKVEPPKRAPSLAGASPLETFERAFGFPPKAHQVEYLTASEPTVVLAGRQTGKTAAAAALAVHTALTQPGSTTVIISPSLRQSSEVSDRARHAFWEFDAKLRQDSVSLLRTDAGSRIVSLPGSARGIRGYACALVIVDEAAFCQDDVWAAARPLVAATGGRLIVQSTPGHAVGWFWELCSEPPAGWRRIRVTSAEAGTVPLDFLESEKATMDPELFAQEYGAEFGSAVLGTPLFPSVDDIFMEAAS